MNEYASSSLSDLALKDAKVPTSQTILVHIFNALVSLTRIGRDIAQKTLRCLVDAGYDNLETLRKSTWQERAEVLTGIIHATPRAQENDLSR